MGLKTLMQNFMVWSTIILIPMDLTVLSLIQLLMMIVVFHINNGRFR